MCTGSDLIARVAGARMTYAENLVSGDLLGACLGLCVRAVPECGVRRCGVGARRVGVVCWLSPPCSDADTCGRYAGGRVGGWATRCLLAVWGRACVGAWAGAAAGGSFGAFAPVAVCSIAAQVAVCCITWGGGYSTERFLTMRTLKVARSSEHLQVHNDPARSTMPRNRLLPAPPHASLRPCLIYALHCASKFYLGSENPHAPFYYI